MKYVQLEITTRCNYGCFYCAGRDMPQQDMAWSTFTGIVDAIAPPDAPGMPGATISLQGEGEPTLHPRFWDMVAYVHSKRHVPTSIINGSRVDVARIARLFPQISISVDTLDPAIAEKIGRYNLPKVLANLEALCAAMGPQRIVLMTVNLGQPLDDLRAWAKQRGFADHIVQPLKTKADYARRYEQHLVRIPVKAFNEVCTTVSTPAAIPAAVPRTCRFLHQDLMRFYTCDGLALPCCFIKDTEGIESIAGLRTMLQRGQVPKGCAGCGELRVVGAGLGGGIGGG